MNKINISCQDFVFLLSNIKDSFTRKELSKYSEHVNDGIIFESCYVDVILDELSDILIEKGLEKNDEPNSFGIYIESLIDKFNRVKFSKPDVQLLVPETDETSIPRMVLSSEDIGIIRSSLVEFLYGIGFSVFKEKVLFDESEIVELYKIANDLFSISSNPFFDGCKFEISIEKNDVSIPLKFKQIEQLDECIKLVRYELDEWEFPIRTGYDFFSSGQFINRVNDFIKAIKSTDYVYIRIFASNDTLGYSIDQHHLLCPHCQSIVECIPMGLVIFCQTCRIPCLNPTYKYSDEK